MADLKETLEREVKLRAGPEFVLPELGGEAIEPRVFDSTYHDTRDHRLARRGVTLRHRIENRHGLWQLKLPQGNARLELEVRGTPAAPPDEIMSLLPAYLRGESLVPLVRLRTRRTGVRAQGAEITYDEVTVIDEQRAPRSFEELEVELLEGDEKALRRLEKALRRAGAADGETRPKVLQALDLTFEPEVTPSVRGGSASATLAAELKRQYERLLAHDPGTRLGTHDEELHQFRVATRRLRAFLRAGRELLDPDWGESLRTELRWLGGELGPSRDLDVLIANLREEVEHARRRCSGRRRARRAARARPGGARPPRARRALERALLRDPRPPRAGAASRRDASDAEADPVRRACASRQGDREARRRCAGRGAASRPDQGEAGPVRRRAPRRRCLREGGQAVAGRPRRASGRGRRAGDAAHPRGSRARVRGGGGPADRARARSRGGAARASGRPPGSASRLRREHPRSPDGREDRPRGRRGRRPRRARGARRAPAEVRRLDVPEGEGRARRERRGVCRCARSRRRPASGAGSAASCRPRGTATRAAAARSSVGGA